MPELFSRKIKLITIIASLLITLSVQAGIYRWTDEAGNVHYSDKPVSDKAKELKVKVAPAAPQSRQTIQNRKTRSEQFLRAREEERAEKNNEIAEKKRLKKNRKIKCKSAKKEYGRLSRARSIYTDGGDGKRNFIGDEERTKVLANAKADIKRWCKR